MCQIVRAGRGPINSGTINITLFIPPAQLISNDEFITVSLYHESVIFI